MFRKKGTQLKNDINFDRNVSSGLMGGNKRGEVSAIGKLN